LVASLRILGDNPVGEVMLGESNEAVSGKKRLSLAEI
jgi:hypothetical protein